MTLSNFKRNAFHSRISFRIIKSEEIYFIEFLFFCKIGFKNWKLFSNYFYRIPTIIFYNFLKKFLLIFIETINKFFFLIATL